MYKWSYERKEEVPREQRFPSVNGLTCSQCDRRFNESTTKFSGAYLVSPICLDCLIVLEEAQKAIDHDGDDEVLLTFTYRQAQSIFEQATKRAKKWAQENPEYIRVASLLKPYIWAQHTYALPERIEEE